MGNPTYRKLVTQMWSDRRIVPEEITALVTLQGQLGVSEDEAAAIEREVIGMTKEEALVTGMGTNTPAAPVAPVPASAPDPSGGLDVSSTLSGGGTMAGSAPVSGSGGLEPGSILGDRYEVLDVLGRGGMGQVLKVRDTILDDMRALKLLAPEHSNRADLLDRMKREVKLCQKLRHPGIVQVFDYSVDQARQLAFFTMEYVEGQTLRHWLSERRGTPASLEDVVRISAGIISALEYAHSKNVVHLDLKPDNVMLSEDLSEVRILDFGISRALDTEGLQTMLSGAGTPYYMAPEQEQGATDVDGRADVYSLGAMLYELLTATQPRGNMMPPHEVRPEVPEAWSEAVMTALRPRPEDRPVVGNLLPTPGEGRAVGLLPISEPIGVAVAPAEFASVPESAVDGDVGAQGEISEDGADDGHSRLVIDNGPDFAKSMERAIKAQFEFSERPQDHFNQLYISHIPAKKLKTARLAAGVPSGEKVYLLLDNTVFGSAKNCLLIGERGVYVRNDWSATKSGAYFVGWEEFAETGLRRRGREIFVGRDVLVDVSGGLSSKRVLTILQAVQGVVIKLRGVAGEGTGTAVESTRVGRLNDSSDAWHPTPEALESAIMARFDTLEPPPARLHIGQIPEGKLSQARSASGVPADEEVFLLLDNTRSGSGKNCLLVGQRGIYVHNGWVGTTSGAHFVPWDEFAEVRIRKATVGAEVFVGRQVLLNHAGGERLENVLTILQAIQALAIEQLRPGEESGPEKQPESTSLPGAAEIVTPQESLLEKSTGDIRSAEATGHEGRPRVSPEELEVSIKARLGIAERPQKHFSDLFLGDLPEESLGYARSAYGMPPGEEIHLLLDCSVFNSARNGLLVGERGIYVNNPRASTSGGAHFVPWEEFAAVKIRGGASSSCVFVGKDVQLDISGASLIRKHVVAILQAIQALVIERS